jgi:hypothetical protein
MLNSSRFAREKYTDDGIVTTVVAIPARVSMPASDCATRSSFT